MSNQIRVIVFQDDDLWLAQGIEHDICVQAETLPAVFARFELAVNAEAKEGGLDRIAPAPDAFHKMWERRASKAGPPSSDGESIEFGLAA